MSAHEFTTLEELRDSVVRQFGCYMLCKLVESDAATPEDVVAAMDMDNLRGLLDMQELENIVRECSDMEDEEQGLMGIGANSREEFDEKMGNMMRAIKKRIISNFMDSGVKQGFLEVDFDPEDGQFKFTITEKAIQSYKERESRKNPQNANTPSDN